MFYFCWGGRWERNSHFSLRVGESGSCHPSLTERADGEYSVHPLWMHHPRWPNHWGLLSCFWGAPHSLMGAVGHPWVSFSFCQIVTPVSKWVLAWVTVSGIHQCCLSRERLMWYTIPCVCLDCVTPLFWWRGSNLLPWSYSSAYGQTPTPWAPTASASVTSAPFQIWW